MSCIWLGHTSFHPCAWFFILFLSVNGRQFAVILNVWCCGHTSLKQQLHPEATTVMFCVMVVLNGCCLSGHQHSPILQSFQVLSRLYNKRGLTAWWTNVPFPELLVKLFQLASLLLFHGYCRELACPWTCFKLKRKTKLIVLIFHNCINGNTNLLWCTAESWNCTSAFLQIFAVLSQTVPGVWIALSSSLSDINKEENKQAFWIDTQTYLKWKDPLKNN